MIALILTALIASVAVAAPLPIGVMAYTNGQLATPTNFFTSNVLAGTNIYVEPYGAGQVRVSASASASLSLYSTNIEVWIAPRTDGVDGDGTYWNPRDGSTHDKFDTVLSNAPIGAIIRLYPGEYETKGALGQNYYPGPGFGMSRFRQVVGAGSGYTKVKLRPELAPLRGVAKFAVFEIYDIEGASSENQNVTNVVIKGLTIDANCRSLPRPTTNAINGVGIYSGRDVLVEDVVVTDVCGLTTNEVYIGEMSYLEAWGVTIGEGGSGVYTNTGRYIIRDSVVRDFWAASTNYNCTYVNGFEVGCSRWPGVEDAMYNVIENCVVIGPNKPLQAPSISTEIVTHPGAFKVEAYTIVRNCQARNFAYGVHEDTGLCFNTRIEHNLFKDVVYGVALNGAAVPGFTNIVITDNVFMPTATNGAGIFVSDNYAPTAFVDGFVIRDNVFKRYGTVPQFAVYFAVHTASDVAGLVVQDNIADAGLTWYFPTNAIVIDNFVTNNTQALIGNTTRIMPSLLATGIFQGAIYATSIMAAGSWMNPALGSVDLQFARSSNTNTVVAGYSAILAGEDNWVGSSRSAVIAGSRNNLWSPYTIMSGYANTNKGSSGSSSIFGNGNIAGMPGGESDYVHVIGYGNKVTNTMLGHVLGQQNYLSDADYSAVIGRQNYARSNTFIHIFGESNMVTSTHGTAVGAWLTNAADRSVMVGLRTNYLHAFDGYVGFNGDVYASNNVLVFGSNFVRGQVHITNTSATVPALRVDSASNPVTNILSIYVANNPALVVASNRNVGIGLATPGYTLEVLGSCKVTTLTMNDGPLLNDLGIAGGPSDYCSFHYGPVTGSNVFARNQGFFTNGVMFYPGLYIYGGTTSSPTFAAGDGCLYMSTLGEMWLRTNSTWVLK